MENIFYERRGCRFMSWEQNVLKRNINNRVCILINENQELNVGDYLCGSTIDSNSSLYRVDEIVDRRKSKQSGYDYLDLRCYYELRPITERFNIVNNLPSLK